MLIQYSIALYTRQIFNYKNQTYKNISAIPIPTANFYLHNRARKLVKKFIARTKYIEQGEFNDEFRYHNEILRAIETLSKISTTAKKYTKLFF